MSHFFKMTVFSDNFLTGIIYLVLHWGKGRRKRGREILMCERYIDQLPLARPQLGTLPAIQACALTRNQTGDLSLDRPALNPLSHTSQGLMSHFNKGSS